TGTAGGRLGGLQPRPVGRHRAAGALADLVGRATGARSPVLARRGPDAATRTSGDGRIFRPSPRPEGAAGTRADHRPLLVEQGPEAARPGSRATSAATRKGHAPGCRRAGADPGALRARAPTRTDDGRRTGHHRVR